MIVRLGFLVAASAVAFAVKQNNVKKSNSSASAIRPSASDRPWNEAEDREKFTCSNGSLSEQDGVEEEEKEEVKLINGVMKSAPADLLFESPLSREIDFPLPNNKYDIQTSFKAQKDKIYETEMANHASEIERLRNIVKELEEREVKLEGELLEYYGLKEQESDVTELQKQLEMKMVEIDMLNSTIRTLQAERKKLQEEVSYGSSLRRELEVARNKIKELQRQIQVEASQNKGQLLLLKQQVSGLQTVEAEAFKNDNEVEKKLKCMKDLEVEVVELKRKNKEHQHEKRDLAVRLDAAKTKLVALSNVSETEMVAKVREEVNNLRHANEDLLKQVEGLQMNRFSEVEELVYLRWVNACLRYELREYQTPAGNTSAHDLKIILSPRSQEKAKRLMLDYAGSEHGQGDTDLESEFSHPSSLGTEDFDNASVDSSVSRNSIVSKKPSLMQKLKKWGKRKDESSGLSSTARSFGGRSPSRISTIPRSRGPLESLMLRNTGDTVAITTIGSAEEEGPESMETPSFPRLKTGNSTTYPLNTVASSFQVMSKSVGAYKDMHKLDLERENQIKEKAERARAVKYGDSSIFNPNCESKTKADRGKTMTLPPKLALIKEKVILAGDGKIAESQIVGNVKLAQIEKRAPRVPGRPPKPLKASPRGSPAPPPPGAPPLPPAPPGGPPRPPPPPGSLSRVSGTGDKVHRAPEVVEFYQTLMKREVKKDTSSLISSTSNASDARSNMIAEIENTSSFFLAVKADVETQGEFVQSLATEVRAASFPSIEDLVAFVNWLDEELSFLVDERAVLKHFDWPEGKADALREAAFEYQDMVKLEKQVSSFDDDPKIPCEAALRKMYKLLEKVEQGVYALLRTRDMAISRYKEFGFPVDWLLDSGVVGKIKLSSVQLAKKYMKRVASEFDVLSGPEKEPNREFFVLQGVRFAFRVHQFAGGFDAESMKAFEELRGRIHTQTGQDNYK